MSSIALINPILFTSTLADSEVNKASDLGKLMNVVAITACPTGIAHTYMAADKLIETAKALSVNIKVETQGAMGIENELTSHDISEAHVVLLVADIRIQGAVRFAGKPLVNASIQEALQHTSKLILRCKSMVYQEG